MPSPSLTALALVLLGVTIASAATAGGVDGDTFSHSGWTLVLEDFVDERGFVDYEALTRDRSRLDAYVDAIAETSPETCPDLFPTSAHALAYYINAYNALVIRGVVDRGPEQESVWRGLVSGLNFFVLMRVEVGGERMSLKYLEDKIVRARFDDARVHAALNCASISCPRLPRKAFEAAGLDAQLESAMAEFVGDPRHVRVDAERGILWLSKIFDWYGNDFLEDERRHGSDDPTLIDYIDRFRDGSALPRDLKIRFGPYDKGLNKQ